MAHDAHQPEAEHKEVGLQRLQGDRRSCEEHAEGQKVIGEAVHMNDAAENYLKHLSTSGRLI